MNKYLLSLKNWIKEIEQNPLEFCNKSSENKLKNLLEICDKYYYNNTSLITDEHYDLIYDYFMKKYPNSNYLKNTGSNVISNKITLPIYLGSMKKIKPDTNDLKNWSKNYNDVYVISDKLDGVSLLIENNNNIIKAYTRGNGKIGQDISWIIKYLFNNIKLNNNEMIRGELLVSKINWEKIKKKNPEFSNPRNFVSGIISRKQADFNLLKFLDFVGYEFISDISIKPSLQMQLIKKSGVKCVYNDIIENIDNNKLSFLLQKRREESEYEIDGIITTFDIEYVRTNEKYPKYSRAFKMILESQNAETFVTNITWTPSMYGILNPVVNISEVNIEGVTYNNVTGNNANFILNNNIGGIIGPGSKILITRSGGVIPKIIKVITAYNENYESFFPKEYKWSENKVDIMLHNPDTNNIVKQKRIEYFIKTININYFGEGLVKKIFEFGFDSVSKILKMTLEDFLKIEGIKEKLASKLFNEIQIKFNKSTKFENIMTGSAIFQGVGNKTFTCLINKFGKEYFINYTKDKYNNYYNEISNIKGLGNETCIKILNNLETFLEFYNEIN